MGSPVLCICHMQNLKYHEPIIGGRIRENATKLQCACTRRGCGVMNSSYELIKMRGNKNEILKRLDWIM